MSLGVATPAYVYAESAPVFDADTMQQDMELADQQGQDYPMPPPPGQDNGFTSAPGSVAPPPSSPPSMSSSSEQRVRHLEDQVRNLQSDGSAARVEALQREVQALRGQVDELTHQLQQAQSQQKTMYSDLDKRMAANQSAVQESAPAEVTQPPSAPAAAKAASTEVVTKTTHAPAVAKTTNAQPNVAEEQQIYQTAYNLIKAKNTMKRLMHYKAC